MTDVRTARPRSNRFPVLVAAAILVATASAPAIASSADCAAACSDLEFLGSNDNGDGSSTIHWSITNRCDQALSHASFELSVPVLAISPADSSVYYGSTGRSYGVENLTNNPFRSIKFETIGEGIRDGESEVFVFVVDASFDADAVTRVEAKSATVQDILSVTPRTCMADADPVASPTPTSTWTPTPESTQIATVTATPDAAPVATEGEEENSADPSPTPESTQIPTVTATPDAAPVATEGEEENSADPSPTPESTLIPTAIPTTSPAPLVPDATPGTEARGGCEVSIAKSYVGLPRPGAVIEYRLVWSTSCAGTSLVNVLDRLPQEVELVSVATDAALAITENDEVNIQATMTTGQALTATIKVRLRSDVPEGTVVCNEASVRDADDRSDSATACLRVANADRLRLYTKAHTHIRPNRFLTVLTRYHHVSSANQIVMTLPENTSIVRIFNPRPDRVDGRVLTWTNLPASSGKVKVTLQVDADAPMGTILPTEAVLTDEGGVDFYNTATLVITESDPEMNGKAPQLSFSMPKKVIAGLNSTFKLRYRHVNAPVRLELALPEEIAIESSTPPYTTSEPGRVVWDLLPGGSGAVKIRVRVAEGAASGSVLAALATLSHAGGTLQSEASATVRGAADSAKASTRDLTVSLSGARSVRAGLETKVAVKFKYLSGTGTLRVDLPAGVTVVEASPPSATISAGAVVWDGLGTISGAFRLVLRPEATLASSTPLPILASLASDDGSRAVADFLMTVR